MLQLFRKVSSNLYRSSAPTPEDVIWLQKKIGIERIISLDEVAGKKIALTCKLLGIEQVMLPINFKRSSLIMMLSSIDHLFTSNKKTLVHCTHGKDRSGLFIALYRVRVEGWKPEKALKEANSLGFCVGIDPTMANLFRNIVLHSADDEKEKEDEMDVFDYDYNTDVSYTYPGHASDNLSWAPMYDSHNDAIRYSDFRDDPHFADGTEDSLELKYLIDTNVFDHLDGGVPTDGIYQGINPGIPGAGLTFPALYTAI